MSDPTALDSARTGTPDGTNGIKIPTILCTEDTSLEAPGGVALSDAIANGPTAHRAAVTTADTATDMSSAGFGSSGLQNTYNRGALVIWVEFATASANCSLRVVFYDAAGTPAPMALGSLLTFTASAKRVSASGDYMSEAQIIDTLGFKKYKVFAESISSGNIDIFAVPI